MKHAHIAHFPRTALLALLLAGLFLLPLGGCDDSTTSVKDLADGDVTETSELIDVEVSEVDQAEPRCDDGLKNGDETDIDCGGACAACGVGKACETDADCDSLNCDNELNVCVAPACDDGRLNGDESDTDCGGSCPACGTGLQCAGDGDCASGTCVEGYCQLEHCSNATLDGDETDVDCGGSCEPCQSTGECTLAADCASGVCLEGVCQEASCSDGVLNGGEVDLDCGGGDCPACGDGSHCVSHDDCVNGSCVDDICQPASCDNGVQDNDESDIDCGGSCEACGTGQACAGDADCVSGACVEGVCMAGIQVSFDAQGGSDPVPAMIYVALGQAYGELPLSTREGYGFGGWWTEMGGAGSQVLADTLVAIDTDHTLYAHWIANAHTVTFDAQGGSAPSPATLAVSYGAAYGPLASTQREGYDFGGWWTEVGGMGQEITAESIVAIDADHTLYAHWTAGQYTVSFDAQGGTGPNPTSISVTFGEEYGLLAATSRDGYTFAGWWTEAEGGTAVSEASIVTIAADHTLYAHWTANSYTVSFDAQSGSAPDPGSKTVTFGAAYGPLATTMRSGYTLLGWWTQAGGAGEQITEASLVSIPSNHTLYANWSAAQYTVTFDAQGGSEPTPASITVSFANPYGALASTERPGYTFAGWWTEAGGNGTRITATDVVSVAADHTLYAHWTANTYTVSFDAQGGLASSDTLSVLFDAAYGALPTATREGYTFAGWWTEVGGAGTQITGASIVSIPNDHTLFANWTANTYTVNFDGQGGVATPSSISVSFDAPYGTLPTATRTGYTFAGWWTAASGGSEVLDSSIVSTPSDHTLYAHWTPNTYTVTFHANGGGTPNPATKTVTFDAPYGTLATISRTGYTFGGWWTAATGGSQVLDSTVVSNASNHTLFARWTANTYTVSFNANGGGTPNPTTKTVTFGSTYGPLATVSRTGYSFAGWWSAASGGVEVLSSTVVATASNHTLYARWTANTYTVTFNGNGGGTPSPATKVVTFAAPYGALATVSRAGYTFAGWWTAASGGSQVQDSTVVSTASNHTLYARWTASTYTVTFNGNGGGTPSPATKLVTFGSSYGTLSTVARSGYVFLGWYTAASGGTRVQTSTIVTTASNHTLYAQWSQSVFGYTGSPTTWTAPTGVNTVVVRSWGAQGGSATGGLGAYLEVRVNVTPGSTYTVFAGGQGACCEADAGAGGSASYFSAGTVPLVVAAGGGGGRPANNGGSGSATTTPTLGTRSNSSYGWGSIPSSGNGGGAGSGSWGSGGGGGWYTAGANGGGSAGGAIRGRGAAAASYAGGGGGGYNGGPGADMDSGWGIAGGGGGGSYYVGTLLSSASGNRSGNGQVELIF